MQRPAPGEWMVSPQHGSDKSTAESHAGYSYACIIREQRAEGCSGAQGSSTSTWLEAPFQG
ncbi:hypothetical protein PAL_GLEAN10022067 [Pteropus alecto]|uniref:Uncharacterized protein n=1 Tax=Pteropus alecto TaxID=9402 RepID=L5KB17_PTEAL|nr:hypothetical protein PAL_GLEAN10022067 [Pteropus alecto]